MKLSLQAIITRTALALLAALTLAATARAQGAGGAFADAKLRIDTLDSLASKAAESVNVNMDEKVLRFATVALRSDDPEEKNVREIVAGLRGVYVKHFSFDAEGQFAEADLAPVREQLRAAGWSRIVDVRSRREGRNVEVYLLTTGARIDGLTVLSTEAKELTVVNIVGFVDLDKLRKLEGQFSIPELGIERDEKPRTTKQQ